MKTFEEYRAIIAQEYNFTTKLLMPPQYETMAANLYANEKLKGLLEEVREWEFYTRDLEPDYSSACNAFATRIEELIGENIKPNTP